MNNLAVVLVRLVKALEFFESNVDGINLDGLGSVRMAQGIFVQLAEKDVATGLGPRVDFKLKTFVKLIKTRLTRLANTAMSSVRIQTPGYYMVFKRLAERPYIFDQGRMIQIGLRRDRVGLKKGSSLFEFDEDLSDVCLDMVINKNCASDARCFEYMLRENTTGYQLTHQLFYFIVAEHVRN